MAKNSFLAEVIFRYDILLIGLTIKLHQWWSKVIIKFKRHENITFLHDAR